MRACTMHMVSIVSNFVVVSSVDCLYSLSALPVILLEHEPAPR